ncbi:MAG: alpha/beta fold hydrolase [Candidatus Dojkabacteria bacterium]
MNYDLVLIHGWGGSKRSLEPLGEYLKKSLLESGSEVSLHILELPGFGESSLDSRNLAPLAYSLKDYSEFVLQEINSRFDSEPDKSELVLIGHSMGGKILLDLASKQKIPSAKIVLVNASGIKPKNTFKKVFFKLVSLPYQLIKFVLNLFGLEKFEKLIRKAGYKFLVRARDYEKTIEDEFLKGTLKNIVNEHIGPEELTKIDNPTLVLWGENDRATPLWMGETIAQAISTARLEVVSGGFATHGLPLKAPEVVADNIIDWLKEE